MYSTEMEKDRPAADDLQDAFLTGRLRTPLSCMEIDSPPRRDLAGRLGLQDGDVEGSITYPVVDRESAVMANGFLEDSLEGGFC